MPGEAAKPTAGAVEQVERKPDDDRRQGERQVDDRVQQPAPREAVPDERDREHDAEERVQGNRDRRDDQRQPECVQRLWIRYRRPGRVEAVLEGPVEDEAYRKQEEQREIAEGAEAQC